MDNLSPPAQQTIDDEIGLLDILVTLAENIKLLILGPLAAGLLALGISFVWPQTFESVAVLQAEPATASLMTTAAVLDPVAQALGLRQDATAEEARRTLRERIKTSVGRNDKLLTLTVSGPSPEQAQATANALLAQTYAQSQPKGSQKVRLERQLAEAQARLKTAQATALQLAQSLATPTDAATQTALPQRSDAVDMIAGSSAGLLEASAAALRQVLDLEALLEGVTAAQLLQAPTLPEKAVAPKKGFTAIMATLATGFLLVIWVFISSGLRNVKDAESLAKLGRVRRALGLGAN
jgi:LPS O-antigen subunit length determinant protein (WzzB/FepE family)